MTDEITLKEILSQPQVWKSVLDRGADSESGFTTVAALCSRREALFVGCGTSFYFALESSFVFTWVMVSLCWFLYAF